MGGHISRQFTVWCATCDEWLMESEAKMPQFIKCIREKGWRRTKGNWQCPSCVKGEKPNVIL